MLVERWTNGREAYRMKKGISLDFGAAATEVVDIVAFQGDQIARSSEVNSPVGIAVACG